MDNGMGKTFDFPLCAIYLNYDAGCSIGDMTWQVSGLGKPVYKRPEPDPLDNATYF